MEKPLSPLLLELLGFTFKADAESCPSVSSHLCVLRWGPCAGTVAEGLHGDCPTVGQGSCSEAWHSRYFQRFSFWLQRCLEMSRVLLALRSQSRWVSIGPSSYDVYLKATLSPMSWLHLLSLVLPGSLGTLLRIRIFGPQSKTQPPWHGIQGPATAPTYLSSPSSSGHLLPSHLEKPTLGVFPGCLPAGPAPLQLGLPRHQLESSHSVCPGASFRQ